MPQLQMTQFKFLSVDALKKNFNALAEKELKKWGAVDDLKKLPEERRKQLEEVESIIDQLDTIKLEESRKAKIITAALRKLKHDILSEHPVRQYMPSTILSTTYNGIDEAIGVSATNQLDKKSEKLASAELSEFKAYQEKNNLKALQNYEWNKKQVISAVSIFNTKQLKHAATSEKQDKLRMKSFPAEEYQNGLFAPKQEEKKPTSKKHSSSKKKDQPKESSHQMEMRSSRRNKH